MDEVRDVDDVDRPAGDDVPPVHPLEVTRHVGRCGRCGRPLRLLEEELLDPPGDHLCWSCHDDPR